MLRDNLVELIEPMLNSAGANPLALTHHQIQASGDRLPCLENPRPKGAESSLTENVTSPFQAEPAQYRDRLLFPYLRWTVLDALRWLAARQEVHPEDVAVFCARRLPLVLL
jgi:hypothetical protein